MAHEQPQVHINRDQHKCTEECKPHKCRPLAASSIRQVHLPQWRPETGDALAVDQGQAASEAESPRAVMHDPHPPTPQQAAAILNAAFTDLPWGVLLWLAMTTGARRGSTALSGGICLILKARFSSSGQSIAQDSAKTWKGHQDTPATPHSAGRGYSGVVAGIPSAMRGGCKSGPGNYRDRWSRICAIR
jgi:hypothetical protein